MKVTEYYALLDDGRVDEAVQFFAPGARVKICNRRRPSYGSPVAQAVARFDSHAARKVRGVLRPLGSRTR